MFFSTLFGCKAARVSAWAFLSDMVDSSSYNWTTSAKFVWHPFGNVCSPLEDIWKLSWSENCCRYSSGCALGRTAGIVVGWQTVNVELSVDRQTVHWNSNNLDCYVAKRRHYCLEALVDFLRRHLTHRVDRDKVLVFADQRLDHKTQKCWLNQPIGCQTLHISTAVLGSFGHVNLVNYQNYSSLLFCQLQGSQFQVRYVVESRHAVQAFSDLLQGTDWRQTWNAGFQ